jgi:hypothetical protein
MARWNNTLSVLAIFMAVMVIYLFFQMGWASNLNLDPALGDVLIAVFPGLFVTIIGLVAIGSQSSSPLMIGGFGATGIGIAVLLDEMYDIGVLNGAVLGGATMAQVEAITIVVSLLMGSAVYATRR